MDGVIDQLLAEAAQEVINQLTASVRAANRSATGKSLESLEIVSTPGQVQILCSPSFTAIETGRKPTPEGTAASTPTLLQNLIDWCRARGIDEKLRYPIAKKIHLKGFTGTPGVITSVVNDANISAILDEKLGFYVTGIINETFIKNKYL